MDKNISNSNARSYSLRKTLTSGKVVDYLCPNCKHQLESSLQDAEREDTCPLQTEWIEALEPEQCNQVHGKCMHKTIIGDIAFLVLISVVITIEETICYLLTRKSFVLIRKSFMFNDEWNGCLNALDDEDRHLSKGNNVVFCSL